MPKLELRADFDRDGRLTESRVENEARSKTPGAIVVANIDSDRRRFPARVTAGGAVALDNANFTKAGADDELLPVRIAVIDPLPTGTAAVLRLPMAGLHSVRLRFYDDTGALLRVDGNPTDHVVPIPSSAKEIPLRLEASTVPGSPYGHATLLDTALDPNIQDESRFELQLVSRDAGGQEAVEDIASFSVAPVLFLDNNMRATRLYICDNGANQPSLDDVREAVGAIGGVELVTVPSDISQGDTWLQDQFQPGIVVGPDGWRHVIVHLPRLRSNFFQTQSTQNLAGFVRSHFPAHDVGLLNDFWARTISLADADDKMQTLSLDNLVALAERMNGLNVVLASLNREISRLDSSWKFERALWSVARTKVSPLLDALKARAADAKKTAPSFTRRAALDAVVKDAEDRVKALDSDLPLGAKPDRFVLPVRDTKSMEVTGSRANELYSRLQQMRSSSNYGGNIEVAPATPGAPLGTIIIGNTQVDYGDFMDTDLRRFLLAQRKQPVAEFNTAWLHVGHIDEILTFVADRQGGLGFAALRASSGLAMAILRKAAAMFKDGLSGGPPHIDNFGPGLPFRLTSEGTTPVTRLLRGKSWFHKHAPPSGVLRLPEIMEPPGIHQRLAQIVSGGDPKIPNNGVFNPGIYFWPGEGPLRMYPADITVLEVLAAEGDDQHTSVNDFIEDTFLKPMQDAVAERFANVRVLPLPVLFDRVPDILQWEKPDHFNTSAFTPDVVNMQVLNGHLLIPRPYGPRMRPADAIALLTAVMRDVPELKDLTSGLTTRFFERHGLTTTIVWMLRQEPVDWEVHEPGIVGAFIHPAHPGLMTLADVAQQFRDGFPTLSDEDVQKRILADNRRHFDAVNRLRDGWRRFVIREETVDLFEACTQLVADSIGLTVHFVDSWFYHTHVGEIHCGTNVLRVPERGKAPRWWDLPDVST